MLPHFRNGLIHDFGEDDVIATRYTTFDHVVDVTGMSIVPGLKSLWFRPFAELGQNEEGFAYK